MHGACSRGHSRVLAASQLPMLADKSKSGAAPSLHGDLMIQPSGMSIMSQRNEAHSIGMAQRFSSIMPLFAATATRFPGTSPAKGEEVLLIWCAIVFSVHYSLAICQPAHHIHASKIPITQNMHNHIMNGLVIHHAPVNQWGFQSMHVLSMVVPGTDMHTTVAQVTILAIITKHHLHCTAQLAADSQHFQSLAFHDILQHLVDDRALNT